MRRVGCLALLVLAGVTSAPAQVPSHKFVVFFQEWSAAIDPSAAEAIATAAKWARQHSAAGLRVTGYADRKGSAKANEYLSLTRAQVVADALAQDGIASSRISVAAFGSSDDVLTRQGSRRAEISIGNP